jgi:hypothetical protein
MRWWEGGVVESGRCETIDIEIKSEFLANN